MFTSYSNITKNGFLVNFDTTKRQKYFKKEHDRILDLKRWGLSIREIGRTMGIPYGSIHYILRQHGKVAHTEQRTDISYLDRHQFLLYYDLSWSSFDYATKKYPELTKRLGNNIYLHCSYYQDYVVDKKGHKDREAKRKLLKGKDGKV